MHGSCQQRPFTSLPAFSPPVSVTFCPRPPCPQDDVDADDGEDDEEAGGEEDEEYMKRLRKAALRMLKGETGEGMRGSSAARQQQQHQRQRQTLMCSCHKGWNGIESGGMPSSGSSLHVQCRSPPPPP